MPTAEDILWFKQQFHHDIEAAVRGTPFTLDMLTAIACQETGAIWRILRKQALSTEKILDLCVGDTLDANAGRKAFPRTKADLLSRTNGEQMFAVARQALVDMARYINGYKTVAAHPDKFCHGFGIFQYDLQFFPEDPEYFLRKRHADFGVCLQKCLGELRNSLKRIGWQDKVTLSDYEAACAAIAYNTGGFKPAKGLKQGHFNGVTYYGEQFFDYLRLAQTIAPEGRGAPLSGHSPGNAILANPSPVEAGGALYEVDVRETPLRLRSTPEIDGTGRNVCARLPDGQIVRAVTGTVINGFLEVETSLSGAHLRGFASARYLKPSPEGVTTPAATPEPAPPKTGVVAVYMPRREGTVTARTGPAGAHSLNEPNQPGRQGATADALRSELAVIIEWLAVDDVTHLRYQPRNKLTFCNIYAHDYCHLAGVYLPRVWWTPGAIESLAQGHHVQPLFGRTIEEQRANDLFRWLRDFGLRFGWRQTGTVSKLQLEVNQGAVGLIVARRREDGRPGHIVVVAPETDEHRARRTSTGEITAPLQSQAGTVNFRYGTGKIDWWKNEAFADSAFWLHA